MDLNVAFENFVKQHKQSLIVFVFLALLLVGGIVFSFWYSNKQAIVQSEILESTSSK